MNIIQVKVPDIGDLDEVEIIELMVKVGDTIAKEQSLITVESDKASMEIPSSHAGTVQKIIVKVGDKVKLGSVVLELIETSAATVSTIVPVVAATPVVTPAIAVEVVIPSSVPVATPSVPTPAVSVEINANTDISKAHASPSVRAFARELGANLNQIKGTEEYGRITYADVQAFVKAILTASPVDTNTTINNTPSNNGGGLNLLPWPKVDFAKFGAIETKARSRIQKISGANLARNWAMIPHVTQFDQADITDLEQFRKDSNVSLEKQGIKLTMLAFVIKACVYVLKKHPTFNASLDDSGDNLVFKKYFHIGFAADTPNGLVVPVLRDADQKSVGHIAKEMGELAKLARDGKLSPAQIQGACFTISSLGGIGGTAFTPIINAPEVAILGLSKSEMKPVWDGSNFIPRLMLPLSVSFDHRVIDGAAAARFTADLATTLADMRKILL
jgi:pyruvate dehydrogenase E2 component (dihydrolipoamide acetyltransferase)